MEKYPQRIKTTKRVNKRSRIKSIIDKMEPGRFKTKRIIKPRKKKNITKDIIEFAVKN